MKPCRFLTAAMLVIMIWTQAKAEEFGNGIHGMQWACPISDHPKLVKISETKSVAYYVDADTINQLGDVQADRMVYGFYEGKLFAGFINLSTPLQLVNLKRHFEKRYGPPRISYSDDNHVTVYRWKTDRIKIKLKQREAKNEAKMAIYYTPLADRIDETEVEKAF
jgi:hypothetical protein